MKFFISIEDHNMGHSAGKISGAFDLGTDSKPIKITNDNFLSVLKTEMEAVSAENEAFNEKPLITKYYVLRVDDYGYGNKNTVLACVTF